MQLDTNVYTGEHEFGSTNIKLCDDFKTLANQSTIFPDAPLNESVFLNACPNDQLSVYRTVRITFNGVSHPNRYSISTRYYKPPINNYFPTVNYSQYPVETLAWSAAVSQDRIGMNSSAAQIYNIYPIKEMSTKYLVLLIMVGFQRNVTIEEYDEYTMLDWSGSYQETTYDDFIRNYGSELGNGVIVRNVYAIPYYGTATSRENIGYLGVSCSMGNEPFGLEKDLYTGEDINVTDSGLKDKLLLPYQTSGHTYNNVLLQGGYRLVDVSSARFSRIVAIPRANPLFWKIGLLGQYSLETSVMAYIDNMTDLTLAYKAYRATGFYFTGNSTYATSLNLDLDDLDPEFIDRGKTDENGKTDGVDGDTDPTGLADDPADIYNVTGYDGNDRVDPNPYVTDTPLSRPMLSPVDIFNRTFAITGDELRNLADALWNADDDKFDEIVAGLKLMGENPMNGLIDCRLYPFNLLPLTTSSEEIIIGRTGLGVYGRKMQTDAIYTFDLGSCKFMKYFDNFLDYSPYTTARLYLPYCGMVPIDTAEFMGKHIECKLIVDVLTGACCCCIFCDGILTITANGMCGCEIAMTGTDSASYANAVVGSFVNGVAQIAQAGVSLATGAGLTSVGNTLTHHASQTVALANNRFDMFNKGRELQAAGINTAGSAVGSITGAASSFWQSACTPVQYAQRGASTPSCETWLPQYAYFIVDSPKTDIPSGYGHNVGFACIKTGQLSTFSGFTICSNVDTSGFSQATQAERDELKTLLENGVFL